MFPFDRPSSYGEMLNKIGMFTFFVGIGLTLLVAFFVPTVDQYLTSATTTVEILTIKIPLLFVVPSVVIALLARIVRLHDKVSDLFGLRARFDLYRILIPLCGSLQISVDAQFRDKLSNRRESAMERTYYAYASFEEPKISKALVLGAIDRWTWYWILIESIVLLVIAAAILLAFRAFSGACLVLIVLIVAILVFATYYDVCGRLADGQIDEIVADSQRANKLKAEFTHIRNSP